MGVWIIGLLLGNGPGRLVGGRLGRHLGCYLVALTIVGMVWPEGGTGFGGRDETGRPVGEIRRDVQACLKRAKGADAEWSDPDVVCDLCWLHREIVSDPRFSSHRQLQSLRAQLAYRLTQIETQLTRSLARRDRVLGSAGRTAAGNEARERGLERDPFADGSDEEAPDASAGGDREGGDREWDEALGAAVAEWSAISGGPTQLMGYLGGNRAPPWDYAEDLVDLIQTTIAPDHWRSNGGEGRIFYYRPSRILVISASSRVHDDVTDLLRQLRFLSR